MSSSEICCGKTRTFCTVLYSKLQPCEFLWNCNWGKKGQCTVRSWPAVVVWCHDQDNRVLHQHTTEMKEKMQDCHLSKHNLWVVTVVFWWPRAGKQLLYSQAIHDWTDLHLHSSNSQLCRKYWRDLVWIWILADLRVTAYQCVAASLATASKYVGVVWILWGPLDISNQQIILSGL